MKRKLCSLLIVIILSVSCRLAAYETIPVDTDGDGIPDDEAVLLPPFEVNGNDPDTFDWEGYWEWLNDISEDEYSEDEMGGASIL